jgi:hypothetical protein
MVKVVIVSVTKYFDYYVNKKALDNQYIDYYNKIKLLINS